MAGRHVKEMRSGNVTPSDPGELERFRNLFALHPIAKQALAEVRRSLQLAKHDRQLTLLIGPTAVGKTMLWRQIEEEFRAEAEADPAPDRIGSMYVRLEPHTGRYTSARLDRQMLLAAQEPLIDRKQILPGKPGTQLGLIGSNEGRRQALHNVLARRRPSALCLDEAQHLTYLTGRGLNQALDDLKVLADGSAVPLLFMGTYELAGFADLSAQLARRTREVHFARYLYEFEDLRGFFSAVRLFVSKVLVDFDPRQPEVGRLLYVGSIGCIGVLKPWLDRALKAALHEGRRAISLENLRATALPAGKLQKLAEEAKRGEDQMQHLRGSWKELTDVLGVGTAEEKRKGRATPGRRKPVRDPVGAATGDDGERSA